MRALWIESGDMRSIESETPVPRKGEALIRVSKVGICGTDLALAQGMHRFRGVPDRKSVV